MSEILSRYLQFTFEEEVVGAVTSIQLQIQNNIINITNFTSGEWQKKMKAGGDWTMTVGLNFLRADAGQGEIAAASMSETAEGTAEFGPSGTPVEGDITWSGEVLVESVSYDASDPNQQVTGSVTLSGNGALTQTITPAA